MSEGGRYAVFIWTAYGVTGLVAAALVAAAVLGYRSQVRALALLQARLGTGTPSGRQDD